MCIDLRISANIVREMLHQSKMTVSELGNCLGVSRQQASTYVTKGVVKIATLREIESVTKITVKAAKAELKIENWL